MHDEITKDKVNNANLMVVSVLRTLNKNFPRKDGNKLNLPKFHGMSTMVEYI